MSPEEEAKRMLSLHCEFTRCHEMLTASFQVIMQRTQLLLTLATLTLTITGFSGPKMAASNELSRITMIGGITVVLLSILVALIGVMSIRWTTQFITDDPEESLAAIIYHRNRKTRQFIIGISLLVVGLTLYVASVVGYLFLGM